MISNEDLIPIDVNLCQRIDISRRLFVCSNVQDDHFRLTIALEKVGFQPKKETD